MEVVEKGKIRTYDMGGKATSLEIGKAIAEKMERDTFVIFTPAVLDRGEYIK